MTKQNIFGAYFLKPTILSLVSFVAVWYYLGDKALMLVVILSILETTLSFDNAVVNAKVLEKMSPMWQKRFLTWGILLAVFGTRFLLPILIVSIAVFTSPLIIAKLAFNNPTEYGHLLESVSGSITAFGGIFLLLVALNYFFDTEKTVHWFHHTEKHFAKWAEISSISLGIALFTLLGISFFSEYDQATTLTSGLVGIMIFILMQAIAGSLSTNSTAIATGGLSLFIYLNVLDSAFSLDGVIGAFALSSNLLIIMVGLGIGAYFVRSMTLYFVSQKTLTELVYLEHGAHWAILGLALSMLCELLFPVPDVATGLIGLFFVVMAYISSRREQKNRG